MVIAFPHSKWQAQRSKLPVFCFLVQLLLTITKALPFHQKKKRLFPVRILYHCCFKLIPYIKVSDAWKGKLKQSSIQIQPRSAYLKALLEAIWLEHLQRTRLVILLFLIAQKNPVAPWKYNLHNILHKYFQTTQTPERL